MAEDQDVCSPPSKVPKRKGDGKRFEIHLGYGDAAKKVFDEVEMMKHGLGLENQRNTLEWMLTAIRPIFEAEKRHEGPKKQSVGTKKNTKKSRKRSSDLKPTVQGASGKPDSKR